MKKKEPLTVAKLAALALGFYVFDKFGGVNFVSRSLPALSKEISLKPDGTCPAGWIKTGNKCIKL
tara:strand:+ start:534 stop:728 length:195 start_codon:yes stop_codon:yes gene_type:complete